MILPPALRRDENDRWKALISESEESIRAYLVPEINIDLASFIRCVTFRAFLVVFLSVNPNTLTSHAFGNVQRVTTSLSDFYEDRRRDSTLPPDLESILNIWLPRAQYPASLDRILPAYEALWRLIATIVVTCEEDETRALRWVMLDFRDNPRDRQYKASFGNTKSVSDITEDVAGRVAPIARPQHATSSDWALRCIQDASTSNLLAEHLTVPEALKFAALLASMVIGRVGAHYEILVDGITGSRASPWDQRKLCGVVNGAPADSAGNPMRHASTSTNRQANMN